MTAAAQTPRGEIRGDNTNEYKGRKKRNRSTGVSFGLQIYVKLVPFHCKIEKI